MALFSERQQLTSPIAITDEAPQWLRTVFLNQILKEFLHLDRRSNADYFSDGVTEIMRMLQAPIGVKWLIEKLVVLTRTPAPVNYLYDEACLDALRTQLLAMEWFHFFDMLEVVGNALRANDSKADHGFNRLFQSFREKTNSWFSEGKVGWRLSESGILQRTLPREVSELEQPLVSTGDPAAVHITKARGFLDQRPCDSANVIKESVSAVESVARSLVPGASTLGDVVKRLKQQSSYPPQMLTLIEKLYGFASAEPGVRHGSTQAERVMRADAEFAYVTSLAIIRYLRSTRD